MKRLAAALVMVLLWSASASAEGWALAPGTGIGPLTLNMTQKDAKKHLKMTENIGNRFVRYGGEENLMVQYEAGRAVMLSVYKKTIKTKTGTMSYAPHNGVGIGTPWTAAESNLGRNYLKRGLKVAKSQAPETYYAYKHLGMGFRTRGGVIVQIDIFSKN